MRRVINQARCWHQELSWRHIKDECLSHWVLVWCQGWCGIYKWQIPPFTGYSSLVTGAVVSNIHSSLEYIIIWSQFARTQQIVHFFLKTLTKFGRIAQSGHCSGSDSTVQALELSVQCRHNCRQKVTNGEYFSEHGIYWLCHAIHTVTVAHVNVSMCSCECRKVSNRNSTVRIANISSNS